MELKNKIKICSISGSSYISYSKPGNTLTKIYKRFTEHFSVWKTVSAY